MNGIEAQGGMRLQHAIAGGENGIVGRHLGVLIHVVLRMLAEIIAVPAHGHLVERQPAIQRLGLMPQQHDMIALEPGEDRLNRGSSSIT